jgi:outer membrane receptor for ferrienterochelin and colicin
MKRFMKTALYSSVALAAMAASVPTIAQEITSSIRGTVTAPDGSPVAGETVEITNTRTGSVSRTTTNASGSFSVRSLTVGGPYTVRVTSSLYETALVTDIYTALGAAQNFNIQLQAEDDSIEEISITATAISKNAVATGPASTFNLGDISSLPSISRQVRDVIRIDPRVNISRGSGGEGFGINCLGGSSRVNSFTIDGVRANDPFGLNSSGNISRSAFPIPFDTVNAVSVEFSPVDVEYGQFTGCNINVVTKSGSNEFHGSAFLLYNGDKITGSKIDGADVTGGSSFDQYDWGAELGGPIIEDKLFFYGSYEETSTSDLQEEGPAEAGFSNGSVYTLDQVNRVRDILISQYGRDPGELVRTLPNTSRRFFGRLDWNISDNHRAAATYSRLEEDRILGDDINTGRGNFAFSDNFQTRGSVSDTYSLRMFSDWTDNFSTEVRLSRSTVHDNQSPVGGGEAQDEVALPRIGIGLPFGNEFFGTDFVSGPGTFRSANKLDTTTDQFKIKGEYASGDHVFTFGYEYDKLDVFNLFIINGTGTVQFGTFGDTDADIDALAAGIASGITINSSFTGDPNDAAAEFSRSIHTLYMQDEWQVTNNFSLVLGARYDWYTSDDSPILNPEFQGRFGFANTQSFDGLNAFQPRIGFTWDLPEEDWGQTTVTGGFASFSGGDPTVWFANAYQNFGGAIGFGNHSSCDPEDLNVLAGGSFSGIPQCAVDAAMLNAQQNLGAVAAVDPNIKLPTMNRFSLGVSHYTANTGSDFFDDWNIKFDAIYGDIVNGYDFVDLSITQSGTAPDGRHIYSQFDFRESGFLDGCNATFDGIREGFSNVSNACFRFPSSSGQNILLTNAVNGGGYQLSLALQFAKVFQISDTAEFDFRTGYAYSDSQVGNAGGSSTAGSNFEEVVTSNFNNVRVGPSPNNNKHNLTFALTYSDEWFGEDLRSSISAFVRARSGRPLTFVFDANTDRATFGSSDAEARSLLYIPTGVDDPLVNYADGFDTDGFFAFINEQGLDQYAGEIMERGSFEQPWSTDIDLKFSQELPGFMENDKFEFTIDFENFLNFLDSGWGTQEFIRPGDVGEAIPVVAASINDGAYTYSGFDSSSVIQIQNDVEDTLWRIQVGLKYKF